MKKCFYIQYKLMGMNKEAAQKFIKLCAQGDSKQAFKLYAGSRFKHHNPFFKGDANTLITAMDESARENPDKLFEIKRVLQDGNVVAIHSFIKQNDEDNGAAVVHIFRFEGDKIAELWDIVQAIPVEPINEHGMF